MLQESDLYRITKRPWTKNVLTHDRQIAVVEGQNLEEIVVEALRTMRKNGEYTRTQARQLLRYARVWVDGTPIRNRKDWVRIFPKRGAHIHIYEGVKGGGGGGGKSVIPIIGMIVLAVIAPWAGATIAGAMGLTTTVAGVTSLTGFGSLVAGVIGAGILYGGSMLLNALFPQAQPKLGKIGITDVGSQSQAYAISGSQNSANPEGYIPVVFGKHRFTPPLGAKSYTKWEGNKQYFHMLVVWGQSDLTVSDFRIEKTPLSDFTNVEHYPHVTNGDDLKLFGDSFNETSVGTELSHAVGWVTRTVGEAEELSIDIQFQQLFSVNSSNGAIGAQSVEFEIQYKKTTDSTWQAFGGQEFRILGADISFTTKQYFGKVYAQNLKVFVDDKGVITAGPNISGVYQIYPTKNPRISGCDVKLGYMEDLPQFVSIINVSPGTYNDVGTVTLTNDNRELAVFPFQIKFLPKAVYEVRIRRLSEDTDSQYIYDKAIWATMRAITNEPAFSSIEPVFVSELRIQASEQLSGYVSQFNGIAESKCRDYDSESNSWIYRETQNPASLGLYALSSPHCLIKPFADSKIDFPSFEEFHTFCEEKGYSFNFIADTETALWERLVQIFSVGRAAPTTDIDGKWGVIIDRNGKEVKQMFTPRNSWGMKYNRTFANMPHALRVTFIDEESDYTQQEQYVCWDGYTMDTVDEPTKKKATDIWPYDYPGVTTWSHLYPLARRHLAKLRHRQQSLSTSTDWEWLAVRRGDLVAVASDSLANTFGTACIQALIYDVDGVEIIVGNPDNIPRDENDAVLIPEGLQLDDTIIFSEPAPARYGIAIRDKFGRVSGKADYELVAEYGEEEHQNLYFKYPLHQDNIPSIGDLCAVALLGEEYEEFLFASATPNERATCELSLIPYAADELDAAESELIPPFKPPLILDVLGSKTLPIPSIDAIKSDESAIIEAYGSLILGIKVWAKIPASSVDLSKVQVQLMAKRGSQELFASGVAGALMAHVTGSILEGQEFDLRIRLVDTVSGITSDWSEAVKHTIIGRSLPPPNVQNFSATTENQNGIKFIWDAVPVIDLKNYIISGAVNAEVVGTSHISTDVMKKTGTLTFYIQACDVIGKLSQNSASTTVNIQRPSRPLPYVVTKTDGFWLIWQACKTTWPIRHYEVLDAYTNKTHILYTEEFSISARASDSYQFFVKAVDIYENEYENSFSYYVRPPAAPSTFSAVIKSPDGVLLSWSAVDVINLDSYVISNGVSAEVKGTNLLVKDLSSVTGTVTYEIKTKDTSGLLSDTSKTASVIISAPEAPNPQIVTKTDGFWLIWQDCKTTWPIRHYEVIDSGKTHILYDEELGLSVREAGNYSLTIIAVDIYDNRTTTNFDYTIQPPAAPTTFSAVIKSPDSVLLSWSAVTAPNLDSYVISNATNAEVKGTSLLVKDLSNKTGSLVYEIKSKDISGLVSTTSKLASVDINAPRNPLLSVVTKMDTLQVVWSDCKTTWPIRHYEVLDAYTNKTHILYDEQIAVSPRPFGTHQFSVIAIDIYDNRSGTASTSMQIEGIEAPALSVDIVGGVMRVMWDAVSSPFPIAYYEVADIDGTVIQQTKSTYYDVQPSRINTTGIIGLKVRAVDTVGNISEFGSLSQTVPAPNAPSVIVGVSDDKRQVEISWAEPISVMPILYYEVVRVYSISGISYEDDSYGQFDTTMISTVPLTADVDNSEHEFRVRAVNSLGQTSAWGANDIRVSKPNAATHLIDEVVDNYVKFSWLQPAITTFAIKTYLIERVEENLPMYLGEVDAEFFIQFYPEKGYYTHSVTAIDWAGNISQSVVKTSFVDEPPDFQVFSDYDSLFNGTKTSMYLDGQGGMYGPVLDETWAQNYARISGTSTTWQQKIDGGNDAFQAPHSGTGVYQEVVDNGITIASTTIIVTPTVQVLSGNPAVTCKIETSLNGSTWTVVATNAYQIYALNFRYVRYTFTVTNGIALFKDIKYVLKVKKKTDSGTVQFLASHGSAGLWVPFNTDFVDVKGQPLVQVVGNKPSGGTYPYFPYTDFEDVQNPTGFKVFVVDKNGSYVNAQVTWQANGV